MIDPVSDYINRLQKTDFSAFDLLPGRTLAEKLIDLTLSGVPPGPPAITAGLANLASAIGKRDCSKVKVVVFGGGTGLSTIIGGDSLNLSWIESPFQGLKNIFPQTRAIVCTTDDGGSTGELLKDLPLIGLGDLRHVLLSSIQDERLRRKYDLESSTALEVVAGLFTVFNYRYYHSPTGIDEFMGRGGISFDVFPAPLSNSLLDLLKRLFEDERLQKILTRPHCLGNLLITSAIYLFHKDESLDATPEAINSGINYISDLLGVGENAVLPCTTTPTMLKLCYANGVDVTGESKSGSARRGYPVDKVVVDFSDSEPHVLSEVLQSIERADIIIFAPGSLYTSIVPILQVPGLAAAVRANQKALKVLAANLWVQQGETDLTMDNPDRRFYVSDLIKAYHRNIPGGVEGLFQNIMLLGMQDIPGSILQNYAVEAKEPIYLDRGRVWELGFAPIEARIYSQTALRDRRVKHDPKTFAMAINTLWQVRDLLRDDMPSAVTLSAAKQNTEIKGSAQIPCVRYKSILATLKQRSIEPSSWVADILWRHWDIPLTHLANIRGLHLVEEGEWKRCQQWDNVYSFFDPTDGLIKIRKDMLGKERFEVVLLVALGQSLLGDYAKHKELQPLAADGGQVGKVFNLYLLAEDQRQCYLADNDLRTYLTLARMRQSTNKLHFTRVMNGDEGFTPPGLLFGLTYAWYLDNRFAPHIEYKMSIAKTPVSNMVPEQIKTLGRRQALVDFFRTVVFG